MKFSRFDRLALSIVLLLGVALFFAWREAESWKSKLVAQGISLSVPRRLVVKPSKAAQERVARLIKIRGNNWPPIWSRDATMVLLMKDLGGGYYAAVFSAENGRMISRLPPKGRSEIPYGGVFSQDNRILAIRQNEPCLVRFLDLRTGRELWSLSNRSWSVENENFAFTPDNRYVVALDDVNGVLNQLVVYEARTGKVVRKLKRTPSNQTLIPPIQISPDGTQILIGDHGGHLWQIRAF